MKFSRVWAMPSPDTFSILPIAAFLDRWIPPGATVVDPFARNSKRGTVTNDLNPETTAEHHLEATDFVKLLTDMHMEADVVLFDPPYSPRQISEAYANVGRHSTGRDTQNARLYKAVRDGLDSVLTCGGVALSFGWNSAGFGRERGYRIEEVLLVAHGGAHNDTICVAERKEQGGMFQHLGGDA